MKYKNIALMSIVVMISMQAKQLSELQELNYKSREVDDIEFGVLTVGFNKKLTVDASEPRVEGGKYKQNFVFEGVQDPDAHKFIQNLKQVFKRASQEQGLPYDVSVAFNNGLLSLFVEYDASKVDLSYELVGQGQKVVFHFRDKAVLKTLNQFVKRQTKVVILFDRMAFEKEIWC